MKELVSIGIILIFLGMVVLMVGIVSEIGNAKSKVDGKGAGIVMIGPIPVIFGTDAGSVKTVIVLAIVLIAVFLLLSRWYI